MQKNELKCELFVSNREEEGEWIEEQKLEGHSDWVRDVAWAPSVGLAKSIIASCGQVYNQTRSSLLKLQKIR